MQMGMVGLGRMGANMVRRLIRGGHECVVFDVSADAVKELAKEGAIGASSLDDFAAKLKLPRVAWMMVPAAVVEQTVADLSSRFQRDDIIVDGGNSYYIDDIRRAEALAAKGMHYVDSGTSGGVWGLERGFCQMIGGEPQVIKHLDPIFATLAPPIDSAPRTAGREKVKGSTAEHGYLHCGPNGAGHFVKMVHNGIEYGIMAAYAEGMNILKNANVGKQTHAGRRGDHAAARSQALPVRFQSHRHRRSMAARQRDRVVAAGPDGGRAARRSGAEEICRARVGFGRGPMDDRRGDRRRRPRARADRRALRTLRLARRGRLCRQAAVRDALRIRRPPREESLAGRCDVELRTKEDPCINVAVHGRPGDPCVFVIFGATGDLTKRLLMPSLYNLLANKLLPDKFAIVGVSNVEMSSEDFRKQLGDEIGQFATTKIEPRTLEMVRPAHLLHAGRLQRSGDVSATQVGARHGRQGSTGTPGNCLFYTAVSPSFFGEIVKQLAAAGLTKEADGHWRRVIIEKPFGHDLESANALNQRDRRMSSTSTRSFESITISAKKPFRTSWRFASATASSSRCGTITISITCKSPTRKPSASRHRGAFYEATGALRDMVPNHIMALVSLTAMEPPNSFDSEPVRDEKTKVLRAIRPLKPDDVPNWAVRGQYGPGTLEGKPVPGYRAEPHVDPKSGTETYVALKLAIDNWRWSGVPFYLRTGKRMAKRVTEIAIRVQGAAARCCSGRPASSTSRRTSWSCTFSPTKASRSASAPRFPDPWSSSAASI